VFINGGNHHLTSRFCGVVLGSTTISKKMLERKQEEGREAGGDAARV